MPQYIILPPPRNLRRAWLVLDVTDVDDKPSVELWEYVVIAVRVNPHNPDASPDYLLQPAKGGATHWEPAAFPVYFDETVANRAWSDRCRKLDGGR